MSFAIMEGAPNQSQLYLDSILNELVVETGRDEDRYCIGKLLFKCLKDRPDVINTIEASSGQEITNKDILHKAVKCARAMLNAGVVKGDIVMIITVNHLTAAVPYLASTFIGAVPYHIDINATTNELARYIKLSVPKIIFADSCKLEVITKAFDECGLTSLIVSFGDESTATINNLDSFTKDFSSDVNTFRLVNVAGDEAAALLCTGGSTGGPKAAIITNYALVGKIPEQSYKDEIRPEFKRRHVIFSSNQWLTYLVLTNFCTVAGHTKIQSKQSVTIRHALDTLRKYKPEIILFPPGLAAAILASDEYRQDDLKSLKQICIGGSVVSAPLQKKLQEAIHPEGHVVVICGSTEAYGGFLVQQDDYVLGSIGREFNYYEYKIVDENEKEVPVGTTGELWLKPKVTLCKGYYNDEAATKETFTADGWMRTGDLVYKDENGHYFYVERKKLLIKKGNYHVYPNELEEVIQGVEGVKQVGVCGSDRGVTAVVVPRPGSGVTTQQIHDTVKLTLSSFKQLEGGIHFTDALPQTVAGKLDRTALKKLVHELQA